MQTQKINLTKEEEISLKILHKSTKIKKKADRIKSILLLNKGFSYKEIAEILLINDKTVKTIENSYLTDWIDNFLDDNYVCYSWKLTEIQEKEVSDYVEVNIIMDSILVINFIKEKFDKTYTRQWIQSLLHRLDFVFKKTKKVPSKANKEKQEEFLELYSKLERSLTDKEKIYFMDWVHPMHNVENQYWWIKKWTEKEMKSNTWRDRININGAYNVDNQDAIIIESKTINAQSTIELYKKIEWLNPDLETIYVIRDNARYYNNNLVKDYLKTSRIKEICLPTYSPNLNLIERLWLFFKKKITYNKYYEKFSDFQKVVKDFFEDGILECKNELKSFITKNSMKAIWY